ncbi:unnamed protein product [Nezara viridula]|uniref:Uncharacterized protein n=1 Tax=Nezara viridula TaxID=85310 RepID=A0A9P0HPY0_NEZVI|nr:unnamed protein product [Nezara viridula]
MVPCLGWPNEVIILPEDTDPLPQGEPSGDANGMGPALADRRVPWQQAHHVMITRPVSCSLPSPHTSLCKIRLPPFCTN